MAKDNQNFAKSSGFLGLAFSGEVLFGLRSPTSLRSRGSEGEVIQLQTEFPNK